MLKPRSVTAVVAFSRRRRPHLIYAVGDVLIHPALISEENWDYEIGAPVFLQYPDGALAGRDGGD